MVMELNKARTVPKKKKKAKKKILETFAIY
jgi:hypothetical protein